MQPKQWPLWEILERQDVSIAKLARSVGYSPNLVYRIRMGNRTATPRFRRRVADHFNLPESILFRFEQAA